MLCELALDDLPHLRDFPLQAVSGASVLIVVLFALLKETLQVSVLLQAVSETSVLILVLCALPEETLQVSVSLSKDDLYSLLRNFRLLV